MNFLPERIKGILGYLAGGAGLYLIWLILFGDPRPLVLVGGVFVTAFALFLFWRFDLEVDLPLESLFRPLPWGRFFFLLVFEILRSTVRTCYLILTDGVEGRIVAYTTELKTGSTRLLLLNAITLTPVTIGILSENNLVYIHHIGLKSQEDYEEMVDKIQSDFEEPLKAVES